MNPKNQNKIESPANNTSQNQRPPVGMMNRGPMAMMGQPVQKPKHFGPTLKRLITWFEPVKLRLFLVFGLAILSTAFTIASPRLVGRAIDLITDCGAFPTVCIFRPLEGSAMSYYPSPFYQEMREVFKYIADRCIAKRIPVGIAPNIEVSLVVQPADTLYLAHRNLRYYLYRVHNGLLSLAFKPVFNRRLKRGDRKMSLPA